MIGITQSKVFFYFRKVVEKRPFSCQYFVRTTHLRVENCIFPDARTSSMASLTTAFILPLVYEVCVCFKLHFLSGLVVISCYHLYKLYSSHSLSELNLRAEDFSAPGLRTTAASSSQKSRRRSRRRFPSGGRAELQGAPTVVLPQAFSQ